jgi:hypothetical protein
MKTIVYRGGLLRFRIPSSWTEEYGPDGGGLFHRDAPGSGTLRVNVLTFEGRARPGKDALLGAVAKYGEPEWLATGSAMAHSSRQAVEDGTSLTVFTWQVANSVAPSHLRLAVLTYTVAAAEAATETVVREVRMLTNEIRRMQFADTLGS